MKKAKSENTGQLEIIDNKFKTNRYTCVLEFPELTAVCPVTLLPDYYFLHIEYEPDKKLVELKSFKLYLNGFRNTEILHEEITNTIVNELIRSINPKWIKVENRVSVRGGISTTIKRHWDRKRGDLVT